MPSGKVKWFNSKKGYGFITDDETNKDIFLHVSELENSKLRVLKEEQKIKYDIKEETVADIYMTAYKAGLKGITVYREGSREGILITDKKEEKKDETVRMGTLCRTTFSCFLHNSNSSIKPPE